MSISCSGTNASADSDRKYLLERVDEAAVVLQLYADGFEALPTNQRVLIWHLYQAAIAGRDIFYDQRYVQALFDTYGIHFDPTLRDEIVARVEKLKLPSYTGFVQPKLAPVRDADGAIRDARITYPQDLTKQMLEYAEATRASCEQFRQER